MSAYTRIETALQKRDYAALIKQIPYAHYLGMRVEMASSARRYQLPFREDYVGNVRLGALHGGVVAGMLEIAAQLEVLISQNQRRVPSPVDFTVDYLRSAKLVDSTVECEVLRQGSRVAQVRARCWQTDAARPVACARAVFLLEDVTLDSESELSDESGEK